jgi:hypothetical protein
VLFQQPTQTLTFDVAPTALASPLTLFRTSMAKQSKAMEEWKSSSVREKRSEKAEASLDRGSRIVRESFKKDPHFQPIVNFATCVNDTRTDRIKPIFVNVSLTSKSPLL